MSGLEVRDVTVAYGAAVAVDAASLAVERGQIAAIVGPSGCGKSSLLGAIAGIVSYTGTVCWEGQDLGRLPVHQRGVGLVFQDGQLFPHRTVVRNIAYGLEATGVPAPERAARVQELLELVGLEGYGERGIDELSGGERQRVALARSLAPRPRVLALDEPLSSLDAALRARLAVDVRDILRDQGTTAIVVTHDLAEAEVMADRILTMEAGRITGERAG
ncbi:MAG: ABC transporter ATP-binding protein [Actinomycetes bacterium]|nr:MAG: ABC transporter [Actinomycetota bacterium]